MSNPETENLLRERIDDLSTRLLLGEALVDATGGGPFLIAIADLARCAGDGGYEELARVAWELSANLENATAGPAIASQLEAGLGRLQQALERGGEEPAAAEPSQQSTSSYLTPELIADFITESREHLTSIEQQVLTLERDPGNKDALNSVFRGFHTIKGLAGFLELPPIQEVAHDLETDLDMARDGELAVTPPVIDVVLESVDYLGRLMNSVESIGTCERLAGHDALLARIRALISPKPEAGEPEAPGAPQRAPEPVARPEGEAKRATPAAESATVRVATDKLDYLVDMVGEMVIAQSIVHHNQTLAAAADPILTRDLAQLSRITAEVQKTAMAMRMVPIGQVFQKTSRQIRDLSRKIGKPVELVMRGEETELDKSIGEELSDPLMHMVRNALDHGIEAPDARAAAGKPAQAEITLAAYHQAGQIVIEIADDGRGLDPKKIFAKARQRGLVAEGANLSDGDIYRLILEPGFSTAEQVTDISGRGVGMDVVRKQVEKLRGRIEIRTQLGQGTTFLLKLPLTMAIIDGLVVTVGKHRYIVPLFAVREMFRPAPDAIFTVQDRQEMALVRGRLLPIVRLYKRFDLTPRTEVPSEALLIVAEREGLPFCLMVDDLVGKQEVVIKSLGEGFGNVPGVAGVAILGDGRVGLILDMGGLWGARADG